MDGNDTQVSDWIDRNLTDVSRRTDQSDSENDVYNMRSSDDDLKLGAEAILSDRDSSSGRQEVFRMNSIYNRNHLPSQDSESSWTSNLSCSSAQSRIQALSSYSRVGSIASVEGVQCALDSLPLTATDILYNLGFASSETCSQVPPRFLGPTNANLGDWNGRVFWSDQVGPVSNFEYLFNMMDDTPAMEDEIVDVSDNSGDWGSFRSALGSSASSTTGSSTTKKPIFRRSHSLPEEAYKTPTTKEDLTSQRRIKLKRHRSQLCLQQSFDTITEEEEAESTPLSNVDRVGVSAQPNLETIEGSFTTSMDSVALANPYGAPAIKRLSHYDPLLEEDQKWQAELAERLKRTLEEQKLSLEDENDAQAPPQHDTTEEGPARKKSSKESSRDEFRENSSSQPYSKGSNDNRTSSECKGPKVKSSSISLPARDKKPKVSFRSNYKEKRHSVCSSAKLKRQSCEEIVNADTEYKPSYAPKVPPHTPLTPLTKEEETWLDLKKLLEETERKAFNTWLYRLRKKKQSQLRSAISLPEYLTGTFQKYPPTTCRKSWTVCDETETSETSESASEPSLRTGIKKTSIDSMEGEGINVVVDDCCNCFSVPVIVQSSYDDTLETVHNSLMVDMNTDSDSTVRAVSPIPGFKSPMGDAASPVAVFRNVGDSGVIFDQRPDLNTAKKTVESLDEKNEQGKVNNAKQLEASTCRAKLCKSTNPLYMLCQEYRSPFYICTPRLRHKERSSSLPLLSHPELVRSKLRRAVTESPNIQRNVIEEYDADLDDDDLLLEQEEWKGRIYRNILKSMTASAEQNELLLKRIEEQVEGDGDLPSLPHPSSPRRRRSSFSRSADEATVSSSDEATEKQGNLLEVKPRRKRRNSVERRLSIERRKSREHSTDHSTDVSHCLSPCSPRAADLTQGNPLQETCEEEKQKVSRPEIVVEASTGGVEDTSALSTVDETSVTGGELSGNVTDVEPCSALPLYTAPEAERVSDIFLQDAHQNLVGDKNKEAAAVHIEDRGEDWEVKVLQDVLKHFQADYEAQNRAIEERKKIDKRMRMEIKMLETEIAAQRLEMEYLLSTKANANNCSKSQNSTPLKSPLAHSTPLRATPHSTNRSAANKSLSPIQQMLLNRPTDPLNRSMSQTVLK